MWNLALGVVMAGHGLIHLLGFVVSWKLAHIQDLPYKTTLLAGRWEVGDLGIRLVGVLWLLLTVGFIVVVVGLAMHQGWWRPLGIGVAAVSVVVCVLQWPEAQVGVYVNVLLLALLLVGPQVELLRSRFQF